MKLSTMLDYTGDPREAGARVRDLERAGVDMVWVAELYSFDAVSIIGFLAAHTERIELGAGILPVYSRTPTLIAMTAAGLDAVSGGRFVLGLGVSGPQVIEGWHGVPYDDPIGRTGEVVDICRQVWRRDVVVHDGPNYHLPLPAGEGTGLGKPLKLLNRPVRERIPIYLASIGHRNVALTARVAEGWLPAFFHPDKAHEVWGQDLAAGQADRDPALGELEVVAGGAVAICDAGTARRIRDSARPRIALYVGGMGARGTNFYTDLFRRYGFERQAEVIQDLYLSGRKAEAEAAVPDEYLEATLLVGDEGFVRERIEAYAAAGVTRLQVDPVGDDPLRTIERLRTMIG
jgi:F420-dependent oxidoreductase-like protein